MKLDDTFLIVYLSPFLWIGTTLAFFSSSGNLPFRKHVLKIASRDFQLESPQSWTYESWFDHDDEPYSRFCKGWVTYRFSYAKRHNDALRWAITNNVLKFRKTIEFQSSWIVYSYTKSAHIHRWALWKNHRSAKSLAPNWNTSDKKTHAQVTRQPKLEISSYNIQL